MNTIDDELRRALCEIAEEGRPVNLGRAALAGARQRRRTHLGVAAVAVAAAAAIAVPVALTDPLSGPPGPSAAGGLAAGGGPAVVTSFFVDEVSLEQQVLNPATGSYRPAEEVLGSSIGELPRAVAVSPDLRHVAATQNAFRLRIASTVAEGEPKVIRLPGYGVDPVWSPDSRRVALVGGSPGGDWHYRIVWVEADTGATTAITLDLPRGHAGYRTPGSGVAWLDPDHLVVPTVNLTDRYPVLHHPHGERVPLFTGLSVFDLDGALVREVPIDQSELTGAREPHSGPMWAPHGEVRDGQVLLTRQERPGTLQLAVVDLTTGDLAVDPVSATLPGPQLPADLRLDDGTWDMTGSASRFAHPGLVGRARVDVTPDGEFRRTPLPVAWLPDGTVLVDTGLWRWHTGFTAPREHYLVDLSTTALHPVEMPALASPRFGDVAGMSPQVRDRAHVVEAGPSGPKPGWPTTGSWPPTGGTAVPADATSLTFGDASALSPDAAHLAF